MKRAYFMGVGFFLLAGWAAAWASEVRELADRVQAAYEETRDLSFHFVQKTYVAALEKEVEKRGEAQFKKPGKFSIQYAGPRERHYLSNGKKIWVFRDGDDQVQVYQVDDDNVPAEALSFLVGLGNLKQDFAVESVDPKKWVCFKREPVSLQWMELTPLKKTSGLQWLVMGFDPATFLARETYLLTDSGNLTHYVFSDLKANAGLSEEGFEFKKAHMKEIKN
jgi:outer membrane lipoprotein-sorting protein